MATKAKSKTKRAPTAAKAGAFAIERSHRASQTSNDHSRATAQACVLINGGAAIAMIAFLSKEGIDPRLLYAVPFSLLFYASGVFFGALMMYFATEAMDQWNMYWLARVDRDAQGANRYDRRARYWWRGYRCSFSLSILFHRGPCLQDGCTGQGSVEDDYQVHD